MLFKFLTFYVNLGFIAFSQPGHAFVKQQTELKKNDKIQNKKILIFISENYRKKCIGPCET